MRESSITYGLLLGTCSSRGGTLRAYLKAENTSPY